MAVAAKSAVVLNGLGSPFLNGGKRNQSLFSTTTINGAKIGANTVSPRKLVVVAAAGAKKSWIPAVKGVGGNLVDPEWLDGS